MNAAAIAAALQGASITDILHFLGAGLIGLAIGPAHQAIIEHTLGAIPKLPAPFKAMAPSLIATGAAIAATHYGISTQDALVAATALTYMTHKVNASPDAAVTTPPAA